MIEPPTLRLYSPIVGGGTFAADITQQTIGGGASTPRAVLDMRRSQSDGLRLKKWF
jgi:hypothetical protein